MKKWLARLFGGSDAGTPSAAASASTRATASATTDVDPPICAPPPQHDDAATLPDIDLAFFHWLAGPHVNGHPAGGGVILDELARLGRAPEDAAGLVPRVPAVIPQLLRSLREDEGSAAALARQVAQDPVLVAAVIREVNSPLYRPSTPVRNLEGALLLLGQNGLRMLLAQVAFRPVISVRAGVLARQVAPALWRQAEQCALAASLLAARRGADPFEAYLAGLMHNVGMVVAFRVIDQVLPAGALPDDDAFGLGLVRVGRQISARIASQWELPPAIGHAILHIGDDGALPATLGDADRLSKLAMLAGGGQPAFVQAIAMLPEPERQVAERLAARLNDHPDDQDPDALSH